MKYYEIDEKKAKIGRAMWSFRDYETGSETASYKESVDNAYAIAEMAREENKERALLLADRYARKLADNINRKFTIELMCPSVMISGAGNFPTAKKEKQNRAMEKNHQEYKEIEKIKNQIKGLDISSNIIKDGDADAIEKLNAKLERLTQEHAQAKQYNVDARKNKTESLPWYHLPYLTRDIKATKDRIANLEKIKTAVIVEDKYQSDRCKVIENTELMRIQLLFDGKPDETTRNILKSNGFKWAPSQNAWQRQLNANGIYATKKVISLI